MTKIVRVVVEVVADRPISEREVSRCVSDIIGYGASTMSGNSLLARRGIRLSPIRTKTWSRVVAATLQKARTVGAAPDFIRRSEIAGIVHNLIHTELNDIREKWTETARDQT